MHIIICIGTYTYVYLYMGYLLDMFNTSPTATLGVPRCEEVAPRYANSPELHDATCRMLLLKTCQDVRLTTKHSKMWGKLEENHRKMVV